MHEEPTMFVGHLYQQLEVSTRTCHQLLRKDLQLVYPYRVRMCSRIVTSRLPQKITLLSVDLQIVLITIMKFLKKQSYKSRFNKSDNEIHKL